MPDRPPIPEPPHRSGCLCGAVRYSYDRWVQFQAETGGYEVAIERDAPSAYNSKALYFGAVSQAAAVRSGGINSGAVRRGAVSGQ